MPLLSARRYVFASKANMSAFINFFRLITLFLSRPYYFLHACILLIPSSLPSSLLSCLLLPRIYRYKISQFRLSYEHTNFVFIDFSALWFLLI
jgi:hypothetical protein